MEGFDLIISKLGDLFFSFCLSSNYVNSLCIKGSNLRIHLRSVFCGFLMLARSQICADSRSPLHSGDPAVAMEPTNDELSAFVAIEDVATWAGMQGDILASLKLALGNPPNL